MIAYLEDDGARSRAALVRDGDARWVEGPTKEIGGCVARIVADVAGDRPTAVVAALSGDGLGVTWSGVRALTAAGNALAFAWGVPAVAIEKAGGVDDAELVETVRRAAEDADSGAVLVAEYDGDPSITTPKR